MRLIRATGAAVALAVLLVGVPWFLLLVGDPGHLVEVDWATALLVSMDGRLVVALLSGLGWLAWAVIALTVVFEVVALVTRQRLRPVVPGTAWLRPVIAALIAAMVAAPSVAAAAPGTSQPQDQTIRAQTGAHEEAAQPVSGERGYVVRAGDELWSVAERQLGAGERWREIAALNPGMDETTTLTPGSTITLPASAPGPRSVTVARGDSLWTIAERELGDGHRWPEIHRLNDAVIADPDVIDVGWSLALPGDPSPAASRGVGETPSRAAELRDAAPGAAEDATAPATEPPASDPAPPARSAVPQGAPEPDRVQSASVGLPEGADESAGAELLGPIGALTAAGVVAGLATRRRAQLLGRALGRRILPGAPDLARFWAALAERADSGRPSPEAPGPAGIVLGWDGDESPVALDLEQEGATVLTGPAAEAALAAAITGLACAPWSETVDVVVVDAPEWAAALDDPRISAAEGRDAALVDLTRLCSSRRLELGSTDLAEVRADEDAGAAWAATVFVFAEPLTPSQLDVVGDALALGRVGVSVLTAGLAPHIPATVVEVGAEEARWDGRAFSPQLIDRPAKRALLDLFELTGTQRTEPAGWWAPGDAANVLPIPLHPSSEEDLDVIAPPGPIEHPTLLLLGEVSLDGAAGPSPTRAVGQCLEYCAWLLEHPACTPSAMTRAMLVAEPTRRSNMSRLRGWLGTATDGATYLPEAYSGRISLDERVTSDWERFRTLLSGGVNLAPDSALIEALRLVRGEPLGSFAFQWLWAHQVRADMVAMIVDAACCLADRGLERKNATLAMWAVEQGRLAGPGSDELGAREVLAHAVAGRHSDAERAALRLTRAARSEGRDLAPHLARRVQLALHGEAAEPAVRTQV